MRLMVAAGFLRTYALQARGELILKKGERVVGIVTDVEQVQVLGTNRPPGTGA